MIEVQPPGKKVMGFGDFVRGRALGKGTVFREKR